MKTHDKLFGQIAEVATIITKRQLGSDTPHHDHHVHTETTRLRYTTA